MPTLKPLGSTPLNFKDRTLAAPSAIIVASLGVLVLALLFGVFVHPPDAQGIAKSPEAQLKNLDHEITLLKGQQRQSAQTIAARVWQGSQNDVSAAVLARLTAEARQDGLTISSFRPQRTTDLSGVTELPFAVQMAGPYPGVRKMMASLDASKTKVVLRSAQITAATNSTTAVSATLGLSAYLATDPAILAAAISGGQPAASNGAATLSSASTIPATARSRAEQPAASSPSSDIVPKKGAISHGRS